MTLVRAMLTGLFRPQTLPPNLPAYLRADVGLPPEYDAKGWWSVGLNQNKAPPKGDHE